MKIHSLELVAQICRELRADGSKIVLCHGCFDVLGYAHARHLREAKKMGDVLVVTVTPDKWVGKGPGRPVFGEQARMEMLAALEPVDYVALNKWETAVETIGAIQPHFYVKGREYIFTTTPALDREVEAVEAVGGQVAYTDSECVHTSEIMKCIQ